MYRIITFDNGQPAIFYLENETTYLYVITRGKIVGKGIIFNDVKSDFQIFGNGPYYIYYISTNDCLKVYTTMGQLISEIVNLPLKNSETKCSITEPISTFFNNELLILYLEISDNNEKCTLQCISANTLKRSKIAEKLPVSSRIGLATTENTLHITINSKDLYLSYFLTPDLDIKKVAKPTEHYVEQIKQLHTCLESKETEIHKLKSTQEYITVQYNELAEYAGKLQEELRKLRYM